MSSFVATCPACGVTYWHCLVGMTLISGHVCQKADADHAAFERDTSFERQVTALNTNERTDT